MNKILLSARDLKIGGIEKALINLINYLIANNYDVTLILEEKKGELLDEISDKVKIVCYTPSRFKIVNLFNRLGFLFKYYNKFDTSISFATYLKSGSFVARMASKNSILWCHADYLSLFDGNKSKVKEFFEKLYYDYFSKIVFVSKQAQKTFLSVFPEQKNTYYCNNLIDYNKIYKQSEEKINLKYDPNIVTFLNVGRHDEKQKKLTRIIGAAKKLKNRNYEFRIIFVGDGKDTKKYKNPSTRTLVDRVDVLFCHQIKNREAEDDIFRSQGNVFNGCSRLFREKREEQKKSILIYIILLFLVDPLDNQRSAPYSGNGLVKR